jgi:hypothetical protein
MLSYANRQGKITNFWRCACLCGTVVRGLQGGLDTRHNCAGCKLPFLGYCSAEDDERRCRKCAGLPPSAPSCTCIEGNEDSRAICGILEHREDDGKFSFISISIILFLILSLFIIDLPPPLLEAEDDDENALGSADRLPGAALNPGSPALNPGSAARSPGAALNPGSAARSPAGTGTLNPGSTARSPGAGSVNLVFPITEETAERCWCGCLSVIVPFQGGNPQRRNCNDCRLPFLHMHCSDENPRRFNLTTSILINIFKSC